jgi:threonyl-tRNA synthetase
MRLLLLHVDYLDYAVTKATKYAEAVEDSSRQGRMEEALVVFVAAERSDEEAINAVAQETAAVIRDVATKVATEKVVLYPYAHLSSDLASAENAVEIIRKIERLLLNRYDVLRAPFGWYKSFSLKCKGHPLSELSRTITPAELSCRAEPH